MSRQQADPALAGSGSRKSGAVSLLLIALVLYAALTIPYGLTRFSGDEAHFITIPYLMLGGDYAFTAFQEGQYLEALEIAAKSYALAWHYYTRPADANKESAAILSQYELKHRVATGRDKPFVFTPDYFVTHRKSGKPLLSFILNVPALALLYLFPNSPVEYQTNYYYHPAFFVGRLSCWLMGFAIVFLIYRWVSERHGKEAGGWAAIIFALLPPTALWSADLHQDVPMTLFLLIFSYMLYRKQFVWAGIFWGLSFATKNQSIFGLLPLLGDAIWTAFDAGSFKERAGRFLLHLRTFVLVFGVGLLASAPFGHPWANLVEVVNTSAPTFGEEIQSGNTLLFWMPIWWGMGMLGMLAFKFLDHAKDSFDRYHILNMIVPAFLHFFNNTRLYELLPSVGILAGSYFSRKTVTFAAVGLFLFGLYGVQSPYVTVRGVGYRTRILSYPPTIDQFERYAGLGNIQADEEIRRMRKLKEKPPEHGKPRK